MKNLFSAVLTFLFVLNFFAPDCVRSYPYYQTVANNLIYDIYTEGAQVWAATGGYLKYSNNNGTSFSFIGTTVINGSKCVLKNGSRLLVGRWSGVYYSDNNGSTWTSVALPAEVTCMTVISGNTILAGTELGIYKSIDNGATWTATSYTQTFVRAIITDGANILAAAHNKVMYSNNAGGTWTQRTFGMPIGYTVTDFTMKNSRVYATVGISYNTGIFTTLDWGASWVNITPPGSLEYFAITHSNISDNIVAASYTYNSIRKTQDIGATWTNETGNLPNRHVHALAVGSGNRLFAGTYGGIFYSDDMGDGSGYNWITPANNIWFNVGSVYSLSNFLSTAVRNQGFTVSIDNGLTWSTRNSGLDSMNVINTFRTSEKYFVSSRSGLYSSTSMGLSWQITSLTDSSLVSFAGSGSNLYAVSRYTGFYKSTNSGANWTKSNMGLANTQLTDVMEITPSGNELLVAGSGGIYKSTNKGASWNATSITDPQTVSFASENSNIYCLGTSLYYSSNGGTSWSFNASPCNVCPKKVEYIIQRLVVKNGKVYVPSISSDSGLYITSNNGITWSNSNNAMTSQRFTSISLNSNILYLGDRTGGITTVSIDSIVSVNPISTEIPNTFILEQNYPNPFNPETNINFSLPKDSRVTLRVFDLAGKEVAALLNNEFKSANSYTVKFNGIGLASGIYFYRIETGDFMDSKKMILIK